MLSKLSSEHCVKTKVVLAPEGSVYLEAESVLAGEYKLTFDGNSDAVIADNEPLGVLTIGVENCGLFPHPDFELFEPLFPETELFVSG